MKKFTLFCCFILPSLFGATKDTLKGELEAFAQAHSLNGFAAITVCKKNKKILVWGKHTYPSDIALTEHTPFRIGRLTQPLVAASCTLLEKSQQILLNETLDHLFPKDRKSLLEKGKNLTLQDLLCHRSGLPKELAAKPNMLSLTPNLIFSTFERAELREKKRHHDDLNYTLIGALLERKITRPVKELLVQTLKQEMGLEETTFFLSATQRSRAALFPILETSAPKEWSVSVYSKGLFSTPKDLEQIMSAFLSLSTPAVSLPPIEKDHELIPFAQSWDITELKEQLQLPVYILSDHHLGTSIAMALCPQMQVGICLLCTRNISLRALAHKLLIDLCEERW